MLLLLLVLLLVTALYGIAKVVVDSARPELVRAPVTVDVRRRRR